MRPILLLLLAYLAIATLYAQLTPMWQAPDEPAHYNYIRQLAGGDFPVMEPADYDQAYQSEVIGSGFAPGYSVEPFTYEDYQPPLYYLVQTPIFWLSGGDLGVLRQVGVMLGGVTLILAYLAFLFIEKIILSTTTGSPGLDLPAGGCALIATIFFAFLPQHIAMQASVNNDSLGELLVASMILWLLSAIYRDREKMTPERWWHSPTFLGLLLGLAFLTKVTAYLMAPVIGLYLLWRWWGKWPMLLRQAAAIAGPALLLGGIWWGRNLALYGWPDALGTLAHDAAVLGQPTTAEWVARFGLGETIRRFFQTTFRSFWGQFGWMGVVMNPQIYRLLAVFTAVTLGGAILFFFRYRQAWRALRPLLIIMVTLTGLNVLLLVVYNFTFVQHQGRYLFASLIPLSVIVPAGLLGWLSLAPLPPDQWKRYSRPLTVFFALAMIALDLVALFSFILPQLT